MLLRSIGLENFGLYAGTNELDLVPRRRRGSANPIVLIGGKNGAGKTTLLEAVRLALYGRRALGARVAQAEYDEYLRASVHRGSPECGAAVVVEFDYAEAGDVHRYRVRREWHMRGRSITETLLLTKDGVPISGVPRDEWHSFLQELIPPGVSQLFFFDGEKIREIADGEEDNEQLAEAVRGLLGIELVGRLRTDLGLFLARHQREEDRTGTAAGLEEISRTITTLERQARTLSEEVAELTSQRESQARAAEQIRRRFVAEGGDAALHRAGIEAERDEVERRIARAMHDLRDLSGKLLPFAMAPRLVGRFRAALAGAGDTRNDFGKGLGEALSAWRGRSQPPRQATWTAKHWADLQRFLERWSTDDPSASTSPALREVGDGAAALARLTELEAVVRPRAVALGEDLDALSRRLRDIDAALARADNAAAGLLLDELRLAEQHVGATDATLHARQQDLKEARGQLVTLERDRRRLLERQAHAVVAADRAALAGRTAQALAAYEQQLLTHKLGQLQAEFVRCFNHLAHKGNLVAAVRIDPETFMATLVDRDGRDLPKAALSAGEKQVYAIAMLWALARTSGRSLPMIIDTPLARLDSAHRASLIGRYFPAASHQVILLSTDTEVDERLVEDLGDSISHAYRLDYDADRRRTTPVSGYFNDLRGTKGGRVALQQA